MRRAVAIASACLLAACGIDVLGTLITDGVTPRDGGAVDGAVDAPEPLDGGGETDGGLPPSPPRPSYLPESLVDPAAGSLNAVRAIDTSVLAIDVGAGLTTAMPAGVRFTAFDAGANGVAVLTVGAWTVDQRIAVSGTRALAILASRSVAVDRVIDLSAAGSVAGAGGFTPASGPGAGTRGAAQGGGNDNSGGGGAGHGTAGAPGGDTVSAVPGGAAGGAYDMPLTGGSGGGRGDPVNCANAGGGGGGAFMLFSRVSIALGPMGGIRAAGGGGSRGCVTGGGSTSSSASGGGSGGWILLEAPSVTSRGRIAANGGGGGGGASAPNDGAAGEDGVLAARQAAGGAGGAANRQGGVGGSVEGGPAKAPTTTNCGGGGGAVGHVVFHTKGPPDLDGGVVSPAPRVDAGL